MNKTLFWALFAVSGLAYGNGHNGNHGGHNGHSQVGPQGPAGPQGPQGDSGLAGPAGTNGSNGADSRDAANPGLRVGLGGGLRHQEKWFDLDAVAYQDVKNGGATVLGLILIKPGKSWQERENEKLQAKIAALVGEVHLAREEAKKANSLALAGAPNEVRTIEIRNQGVSQ